MALKVEIKAGINPKEFFPNSKHIIIYAFSLGDYHYFRYDDPLNTPYQRALQCLVYWRELGMNCDADFLLAHTQAFDNVFSATKMTTKDLVALVDLNNQLKARLQLPKEPDLMYKLASVVFFDQKENPENYEFPYGINKIKFWKKNTSLTDFFLQRPIMELIPYLNYAGENLQQFSQMIQEQTAQHSAKISPLLSDIQRMTFLNRQG
jgi:hypothetical protein